MAWTQADLTALDDAIKGGEQRVKYRDREVTYRTLDEMLRLREAMRREIGVVGEGVRKVAQISKGM